MPVTIKEVTSNKDLLTFVKFPFALYKGNANWVPQLIRDELEMFDRQRNPAYENADTKLFLAYKDGALAGRVAAIQSFAANKKYNTKNMRWGWFESKNDQEVAFALMNAVEDHAREQGLNTLTGPHGFTDLDPEGMLVEGFEHLPTIANYYNYDYYAKLIEGCGYEKEIDYVEFRSTVPHETGIPPKMLNLCERVKQRSNVRLLQFKSKKEVIARSDEMFHLLDEAFEDIYGSVPLTHKQIEYYIKKYISFVDKDLIQMVVNDKDEVIGFMIAMPSLSRAFQKANGRLFPFGWYHILSALKGHDVLDFYLAGVKKKYQGVGVELLMSVNVTLQAMKKGFKYAESNQELETNTKVQSIWKPFNPVQHKRRRVFKKTLA